MPVYLALMVALAVPAAIAIGALVLARDDLQRDEEVIDQLARGENPPGAVEGLLADWRDEVRRA